MRFEPIITVTLNPAVDRVLEVEHFRIGAHQLGRERYRAAAGKGLNVSKALARLGVASIATGFLGRENSQTFEALLAASIGRDLLARLNMQFLEVPGQTRENVTIIDAADQAETHLRDRGPQIAERDVVRLKRKLDLMSRPGSLVVFGGGMPPGVEPEQFAQIVRICLAAGAKVAVDTSRGALAAVRDEPLFIVKPNREELAELLGRDPGDRRADLVAAGRELAERYEYVLLSLGAEGGLGFHADTVLSGHVELDPRRVISTVGSGDCLLAGFVAAMSAAGDFPAAYRRGLAVATANCIEGAPAGFTAASVAEMQQLAEVEEIA
ncbi:MAG: Tagatose-6-phosphate kinase [Phycisphaerae bacterium]|nr:Tagatose-6-phosphate kinase [Phycisphaerae bacterium]